MSEASLESPNGPPLVLSLPATLQAAMVATLQALLPVEGCGFLAGQGTTISHHYPIDNLYRAAPSGRHAFAMDRRQQVDALLDMLRHDRQLLAVYHSHPQGPAAPSPTDMAHWGYPGTAQLIVAFEGDQPTVRAFILRQGRAHPIPLTIPDDRPKAYENSNVSPAGGF